MYICKRERSILLSTNHNCSAFLKLEQALLKGHADGITCLLSLNDRTMLTNNSEETIISPTSTADTNTYSVASNLNVSDAFYLIPQAIIHPLEHHS